MQDRTKKFSISFLSEKYWVRSHNLSVLSWKKKDLGNAFFKSPCMKVGQEGLKILTFSGYNNWIDVKIGLQLNKIFVISKISKISKIFKNLCLIYSDLQKHESSCLLSDCFSCFRNHLSWKKVIYIYLHPCLKSFQIKQELFKSSYKISCFDRKK